MPLSAIINGKTIIAPNLSTEDWEDIKLQHKEGLLITMPCCGASGHLRVSKNGVQHFYHARSVDCDWENETPDHIEIKNLIYQTCKSENWETFTEYPTQDRSGISDVIAIKDGKKIGFEVQISNIPITIFEARDTIYRNEGIESYWLLNRFLGKSSDFHSEYGEILYEIDHKVEESIPYIDEPIFHTGTENHVFISKGIRTIGLNIEDRSLCTTIHPKVPIQEWVKQVLNGEYRKYLDNNAMCFKEKLKLKNSVATLLLKFNEFYYNIILYGTYKKNIDRYYKIFKTDDTVKNIPNLKEKISLAYFESERLDKEYRSLVSPRYGLFIWKQHPWHEDNEPFFRLESEAKVNELKKSVDRLIQCEGFYYTALYELKKDIETVLERKRKEKEKIDVNLQDSERNENNAHLELFNRLSRGKTKPREVLFVTSDNLKTNSLIHSSGSIKCKVSPGMLYKFSEDVAKEFEQKGYGEILDDE